MRPAPRAGRTPTRNSDCVPGASPSLADTRAPHRAASSQRLPCPAYIRALRAPRDAAQGQAAGEGGGSRPDLPHTREGQGVWWQTGGQHERRAVRPHTRCALRQRARAGHPHSEWHARVGGNHARKYREHPPLAGGAVGAVDEGISEARPACWLAPVEGGVETAGAGASPMAASAVSSCSAGLIAASDSASSLHIERAMASTVSCSPAPAARREARSWITGVSRASASGGGSAPCAGDMDVGSMV